jgi:hypothetical protein
MEMRLLKPLLALLLAWTFSFQAIAGVVGLSCSHSAGSQPPAAEAMPAGHAGMHHDHAAMHEAHAGHAMATPADDSPGGIQASGCGCGCDCAMVGCSGSCPGVAALPPVSAPRVAAGSLRASALAAAPSRAHVLDLIRPPSMS